MSELETEIDYFTIEEIAELDEFAKTALAGIVSGKEMVLVQDENNCPKLSLKQMTPELIAKLAYEIAEAMVNESKGYKEE